MKENEFAAIVKKMFASKGRPIPDGTLDTFWEFLLHYTDDQIRNAALSIIRSPDDFISVGKIIRMIEGDPDEEAERAWLYLVDRCSAAKIDSREWPDDIYQAYREALNSEDAVTDQYRQKASRAAFFRVFKDNAKARVEGQFLAAFEKPRSIE